MASCSALLVVVLVAGLTSARPHWQGHDHSGWKAWWRHEHQHARDGARIHHEHHGPWPHWKHGQHDHQGQWPHDQHSETWHNTHPEVTNPFVIPISAFVYASVDTTTQHYDKQPGVDTTIGETGTNPEITTNQDVGTSQEGNKNLNANTNQGTDKNPGVDPNQKIDKNTFDNTTQEIDKNPIVDLDQNLDKWMDYLDNIEKNETLNILGSDTPQKINQYPFDNKNYEVNKNPDIDKNHDIDKNYDVNTNQTIDLKKWIKYLDEIEKNESMSTLDYEATQETNTEQGSLENTNQNVVPYVEQSTTGPSNHPDVETNTADQKVDACQEVGRDQKPAKNIHGNFTLENGFWVWIPGFPANNITDTVNRVVKEINNKDEKTILSDHDWNKYIEEINRNKTTGANLVEGNNGTKSKPKNNHSTKSICDEMLAKPDRMYFPDEIKECSENSDTTFYDPVEKLTEKKEIKDKDVSKKDATKLTTFEDWVQYVFNANEGTPDNLNIETDEKTIQDIEPNQVQDINTNKEIDIASLKTAENLMDYVFNNGGTKIIEQPSTEQNCNTNKEMDVNHEIAVVQDFNTNQATDSDVGSLKTTDDWMDYVFNSGGTKGNEEPSTEQNFNTNQEIDPYQEIAEVHDFDTNQEIGPYQEVAEFQDFNTNQEIGPYQEVAEIQDFNTNQEINVNQGIAVVQDFNTNQAIDSDVGSLKTTDDWMDYVFNSGGTKGNEEPSTEQNFNTNQEIDPYQEIAEVQDFNTNQEIGPYQEVAEFQRFQ